MNGLREIETKNALWERALRFVGVRRNNETAAAIAANNREYHLSPESLAALARGDRQRATGVYESSYDEARASEDSLLNSDAEDEREEREANREGAEYARQDEAEEDEFTFQSRFNSEEGE